jgi:hypothetical protein
MNEASTETPSAPNWRDRLAAIRSKGSTAPRPGSLAALAACRKQTHSQFFTPPDVVALVWALLTPAAACSTEQRRLSLLDTSCGTGALFTPATPERFTLAGCDIDAAAVEQLTEAAETQGFQVNFLRASLAEVAARQYDVALLNPPFSIPFASPNLAPLPCTSFGRFGPNTSAVSHLYAIEHALEAARNVLAIVPTSIVAARLAAHGAERLLAALRLPRKAFLSEGTEVDTSLLVYAAERPTGWQLLTGTLDAITAQGFGAAMAQALACHDPCARARLTLSTTTHAQVITLPVTGDTRCRVSRNGRRINLKFHCGLVQARTLNALLREPVPQITDGESHRYPEVRKTYLARASADIKPAWFTGSGPFSIDVHLVQPDPMDSFAAFIADIRATGADPMVDPGLVNHLRKRVRRLQVETTPLRRWVKEPARSRDTLSATARNAHLMTALDFRSPRVAAGEVLAFDRVTEADGRVTYAATLPNGKDYRCTDAEFAKRFTINGSDVEWRVSHPGRAEAFPGLAATVERRAIAAGIDRMLTWGYQWADFIEHALVSSDINSWVMGLGKARLSIALCLLGGRCNAVLVEPHLVDQMRAELAASPLPDSDWQVIENAGHLQSLKRINVLAYSRVRMAVTPGAGRRTFARALRRRFHTVVADEAHALKSMSAQRTRALWMLSPQKKYALTGTLLANYPRDAFEVARWVSGDGSARNPFGRHHPYLLPAQRRSCAWMQRGQTVFMDRHVSLEWVTNEFAEEIDGAAKRETPRLANPEAFRAWLAPMMKRRVTSEPEVVAYIREPTFETKVVDVPWDAAHFAMYRKVAAEFAAWYREAKRREGIEGKRISLVTLLARVGAVVAACNAPHRGVGNHAPLLRLTSKQRAAIAQLDAWHAQGRQSVAFSMQPDVLDKLAAELRRKGRDPVVYHGGIPIAQRNRDLKRFINGDSSDLLASIMATQTGLNLPMGSRAVFLSRAWSATSEAQALGRLLRPQQTEHVQGVFLHLAGGIDSYMGQLVAFKQDAARVGIDDQDSALEQVEFLHLDSILGRFVEGIEQLADRDASNARPTAASR